MDNFRTRYAGFILLLLPLACHARSPKIAPDLDGLDPHSIISVIVQFAAPPDSAQHGRIDQAGGVEQADLPLIRGEIVSIPASALSGLANDPNVVYVSPDRQVSATLDYANPTVGAGYALSYGWDGTGVGIAIIDSGILQENDLLSKNTNASNVSRIVYNQSFIPKVSSTSDQYGHGTHVAGIITGNGTASTGQTISRHFGAWPLMPISSTCVYWMRTAMGPTVM